jgi:tartrate dehydratase beta subunit/fumarate hydratase class I family protein
LDLDKLTAAAAGESVELTGAVLSLRDASAARLAAAIARGEPLPVSLPGRVMYAVGPSPPKRCTPSSSSVSRPL